ncbi:MAG: hypothetical protein V4654_10055 [Bdellovibrionota bacterium]
MNLKKLALSVIAIIALLILGYYMQQNNSNTRKICSPIADKMVCHECSCPMGHPIPSNTPPAPGMNGSVACPDGAIPTCKPLEN